MSYVVLGELVDTPAKYDEDGRLIDKATYKSGWHVDSTYKIPELANFLISPQPSSPQHAFSGVKTYAYRFANEQEWLSVAEEYSDEEGNIRFTPPPARPPSDVTRRQFVQQLILEGIDETVKQSLNAIADGTDRKIMKAWFEESQVFEIDRPELNQMIQELGFTEEFRDEFFRRAMKL